MDAEKKKIVALDRKYGCVSKHITLKTNVYELLQKNHKYLILIYLFIADTKSIV